MSARLRPFCVVLKLGRAGLALIFALMIAVSGSGGAVAQETAAWPGYKVDAANWGVCHTPWTEPPVSCALGANFTRAGYIPFLAQIFVDRPEEDFDAAFRRGKTLYEMQHVCGGVLVAPNWVLTAGHCIEKRHIGLGYKVRLGVDRIADRDAGVVFEIADVIPHPSFKTYQKDDLALVRLAEKPNVRIDNPEVIEDEFDPRQFALGRQELFLKFINIARPANAPPSRFPWMFETVTVYGWGKTKEVEGDAPAPDTYRGDLHALPNEFCARLEGYGPEKISPNIFCAAHPERKTCRGDSGGPVLDALGNIIGIVSWGKSRCAGDGQPGIYTRVAAYAGWIDSVIGADLKKRAGESRTQAAGARPSPLNSSTLGTNSSTLGTLAARDMNDRKPTLSGLESESLFQLTEYPGYCLTDWLGETDCLDGTRMPWPIPRRISGVAHILETAPNGGQPKHICSGVLVAPDWVLTAAHCLKRQRGVLSVGVGYTDLETGRLVENGAALAIEEIVVQPGSRRGVNLALARFRERPDLLISNPTYSPVLENGRVAQLATPQTASSGVPRQGARAIRFSDISTRGSAGAYSASSILYRWSAGASNAPVLSAAPLFSLTADICNQALGRGDRKFDDNVYCALSRDRPLCPQDAGAPVYGGHQGPGGASAVSGPLGNDRSMQRELLVAAIVGWDKDRCAEAGEPAAFIAIPPHKDWIRAVVKDSYEKRKRESARIFNASEWVGEPSK